MAKTEQEIHEKLTDLGFKRYQSDEPAEDYWTYETNGSGTDILVEELSGAWSIARSANPNESQGEWINVAAGISPEAMVDKVCLLLS